MYNYDLVLTLTGGLGAALILGYITQRIGLSPIVGYLLAGTLVGPYTPGFVSVLASAGMANSTEVIRSARALNPAVRVLARASYLRDIGPLRAAGANTVYSGEGEVALAFVEDILESLGATPEQIDRERARAHRELSADP